MKTVEKTETRVSEKNRKHENLLFYNMAPNVSDLYFKKENRQYFLRA